MNLHQVPSALLVAVAAGQQQYLISQVSGALAAEKCLAGFAGGGTMDSFYKPD